MFRFSFEHSPKAVSNEVSVRHSLFTQAYVTELYGFWSVCLVESQVPRTSAFVALLQMLSQIKSLPDLSVFMVLLSFGMQNPNSDVGCVSFSHFVGFVQP